MRDVKYWEIIADNLKKAGWSWGWVSALDLKGRTIWITDAHGYGKGFIAHADGFSGLNNPISAAAQPSQVKRNRAEKLLSRHREPYLVQ